MPFTIVTNRMICADGDGVRDVCGGDSGGPLVCYVDGKWQLYGVVSYGEVCSKPTSMGVYARVSEMIPWIEQTIQQNS